MAWQSLRQRFGNDLSGLPLVLAGPILRRTEKDLVSVWIALKAAAKIELQIYDPSSNSLIMEGSVQTVQLGLNLHVAVITASNGQLNFDQIYTYDLNFLNINDPNFTDNYNIFDQSILNNSSDIKNRKEVLIYSSINAYSLPSFLLPAKDIDNLRVIHGSCRKPHGGIENTYCKDALSAVDDMIKISLENPIKDATNNLPSRPQLLFLTGDQIYADDVATSLMVMIRDAVYELSGDSSLYTNSIFIERIVGDENENEAPLNLFSTQRQRAIKESKLTAYHDDIGVNHLMLLFEFYVMYLFVWSDILWDNDLLSFDQIPEPNATWGQDEIDKFNQNNQNLLNFKASLKKVRRALANIPTYMIFDDHDVTDDWFFDLKWSKEVLANIYGRRIIQNGLSAFYLFQAWGNNPLNTLVQGTELRLIELLEDLYKSSYNLKASNGSLEDVWDEIGKIVLPEILDDTYVSFPTTGKRIDNIQYDLKWNFTLVFNSLKIIVLDSRTKRGFIDPEQSNDKKRRPPALISSISIDDQFDFSNFLINPDDLLLVISPAPLLGHPFAEEVMQPNLISYQEYERIKKFKEEGKILEEGILAWDREAWIFHQSSYEAFLDKVSIYKNVIILSGDVHYGFTNKMEYWNNNSNINSKSVIAQLTSSSLKNENSLMYKLFYASTSDITNKFLVWKYLPKGSSILLEKREIGTDIHSRANLELDFDRTSTHRQYEKNNIVRINSTNLKTRPGLKIEFHKIERAPDNEYSVELIGDTRGVVDRGILKIIDNVLGKKGEAYFRKLLSKSVGRNNIGDIQFIWNDNSKKLKHNFWYSLEEGAKDTEFHPYILHEISFDTPLDSNKPSNGIDII